MSAIVILAVVVLVLGAAAALFTVQRNRDTQRAVGHLARETKGRDAKARKTAPAAADDAPSTGREVELATAAARSGSTDIEKAAPTAPVAWTPPDEDAM